MRPGPGARESLLVAALIGSVIWFGHLLVAGVDVGRMHWSDSVPRAAGAYGRQLLRSTTVNPYQRWRLEHWAATRAERVIQEITDWEAFEARSPLEKLSVVAFDDVNSCIRKRVWERIPFSRVEFGEDIDWGLRVLREGYAIVYEPRARVLHSHNDSLWRDFRRVYADHRNLNRLLGMRQVPTLYHVLNSKSRPKVFTRSYRTGEADYDKDRVGWKVTEVPPPDAKAPGYERRRVYDTAQPGRGNGGHTFGDDLTDDERAAVIEYLKSL